MPAGQRLQRAEVNATSAPIPEGLLHERVAEQALRTPERVAVVSGERRLTYEDLRRRARQLGRQLRKLGVRPNQLVAIMMEKGWEQVVGVLGVQESGAAHLPIDPNLPPQRYRHLLQKGEVSWAVTQPWIEERLEWPEGIGRLVVRWEDQIEVDEQVEAEWKSVQRPEDLAYVIFTSGSTGQPKGVMIDHRGALNTVVDCQQRGSALGQQDRVLALSSLSFDLSVYDIFGLLVGRRHAGDARAAAAARPGALAAS